MKMTGTIVTNREGFIKNVLLITTAETVNVLFRYTTANRYNTTPDNPKATL